MARRGVRGVMDTSPVVPVYSSHHGRICPNCRRPVARCTCRAAPRAPTGDGVVRVQRETRGRGGKTVTTVTGVALSSGPLRELAGELKRICGSGGTVKAGVIEIQGDHRDHLLAALKTRGYEVKLAGG